MERSYDAVVVGSGFGGGIAACRLAEAGLRVCVLERGRRFGREDFPDRPEQASQMLWHPNANPRGFFDVRLLRDVSVITAAGVGGGSLVYANVQLRAPADVFERGWPSAINRAELDPWYTRTEEALEPRETPTEPALPKVAAFAATGRRAGREAKLLPLAVHFGEPRDHPFSGVAQEGCQNLGRCDIGCPVHAKNTVDITYIARAESRGAEVHPLHLVTGLEPPDRPGGRWRVAFRDLGDGTSGSVEAPTVVVAAGTLGSTRLLLQNRRRLPALSRALGSRFSGNGDALAIAFDPDAPDVRGARHDYGPVMTSHVDYTADRRLIVADGGLPTNFGVLLDVARGVNVIRGWRRLLLRARDALTRLGLSDQALHPREVEIAERRADSDSLIFLLIGRDAADGQMRLTRLLGRLDIRWDKAASAKLFADLERTASELARAAEATPFYALDGGPLGKFTTVHPLGGCPMADDPSRGVVDDAGRVHGYSGLYVLDGSIVPTARRRAARGGARVSPSWRNHTGNQRCEPREIVAPASLEDLVALVGRAEREQTTVRAVGAGHSWSDAALTDGFLILPERLGGLVELDDGTLRPELADTRLARVLGGTHLHALNTALERAGLALRNMGGYDAQTISGVVSTSTHGSGLEFGPFPDLVRSLDLVVAGGEVVRVEPAAGITDPAAFGSRYGGDRRLIQDDRTFAAAVCGIGCMGVIHSLVIDVREKFWLNEVRTLSTWEAVRGTLTADGVLGEGDHYELFLNPYPRRDGEHRLLVTRRRDCPDPGRLPPDKQRRHPLTELKASLPVTGWMLRQAARFAPSLIASQFDRTLAGMVDDGFASISYRVFNIGEANKLPAYSSELAVSLEGGRHVEAIDRILAIAKERRQEERLVHTSPIALRFVAPSRASASMMEGQPTMMIELILVDRTRRGYELLDGYEERLADLEVRPHWGQHNRLTRARIQALYPRWSDWMEVEREFNGSGVFDSPFTGRVGISEPPR